VSRVQELLDYNWNHNVPIDIVGLCHRLGLTVKVVTGSAWDGALDVGSKTIYARKATLTRERFAIAHELAHWELHRNETKAKAFRCDFNKTGWDFQEIEANRFAVSLLAPWNYVWSYQRYETVAQMAARFQVSEAVIEHVLKYHYLG
jgi:hypothetical protein